MTTQTAQWPLDLRRISGIVHITHRMPADWMTRTVREVKTHYAFLSEIVRKRTLPSKMWQVSVFHCRGLPLCYGTRCDAVAIGAQQLRVHLRAGRDKWYNPAQPAGARPLMRVR